MTLQNWHKLTKQFSVYEKKQFIKYEYKIEKTIIIKEKIETVYLIWFYRFYD